jgi:hypothetical protein
MIPAPLKRVALAVAVSMLCAPAAAQQNRDKVSLCTNWVAEAEHGGHYQGLVDGTYRRYGLDVTIVPGGPNVNNRISLSPTTPAWFPARWCRHRDFVASMRFMAPAAKCTLSMTIKPVEIAKGGMR